MRGALLAVLCATMLGCASDLAIQGDSRVQIWRAEASQVKVRSVQSRVLDTERRETLLAVVIALQDLGFQIAVLDEVLGIVSGKKFVPVAEEPAVFDPFYVLYDDESLAAFSKTYLTWGPFRHRADLVRLTVTLRERNEEQLVVRASVQHHLRAVEDPVPYQKFFRTLEQVLFIERQIVY